jgi:chromosome segregation ATPase
MEKITTTSTIPSTAMPATPPETGSVQKRQKQKLNVANIVATQLKILVARYAKEVEYVRQQTNKLAAVAASAPREVVLAFRDSIKKHSATAEELNTGIAEQTKVWHEKVEALGTWLDIHDTRLTEITGLMGTCLESFDAHEQQLKLLTNKFVTLNEKVDTVNEKIDMIGGKVFEEIGGLHDNFLYSIRKLKQENLQRTIAQELENKNDLQRRFKIAEETRDHVKHQLEGCNARLVTAQESADASTRVLAPAQFAAKNLMQVFDAESERCHKCEQGCGVDTTIDSTDGIFCKKCWQEETGQEIA